MNEEMKTHTKIALWLGYKRNDSFPDNSQQWWPPSIGDSQPLPDFSRCPAHYEHIKAKLRELKVHYELDYQPHLKSEIRHSLVCYGNGKSGEWAGFSEGDILTQCALALIKREL